MGPADLDDVLEVLSLLLQALLELLHRREGMLYHLGVGGDAHRGGEGVVAGLRLIDIFIGVDQARLAQPATIEDVAAIGNHLIDIHIGLRAATGLPDDERELIIQLALDDLVARLSDEITLLLREDPQLAIGISGRLLQIPKGGDDLVRHRGCGTDPEVIATALRLGSPVLISGDLHLAHGIMLDTILHNWLDYLLLALYLPNFLPKLPKIESFAKKSLHPRSTGQTALLIVSGKWLVMWGISFTDIRRA